MLASQENVYLTILHALTVSNESEKARSTPVSTVLRKSVTSFIINIFLIQKTLSKLKSGKWCGHNNSEWKYKIFLEGARSLSARFGNRSVFMLDPRLRRWLFNIHKGFYSPPPTDCKSLGGGRYSTKLVSPPGTTVWMRHSFYRVSLNKIQDGCKESATQ